MTVEDGDTWLCRRCGAEVIAYAIRHGLVPPPG